MKKTKIIAVATIVMILFVCVFALSACNETDDVFKDGKTFTIDNDVTNIMGTFTGAALGITESLALDMDQTYFEFTKEGTLHAQIQTKAGLFADLDGIFEFMGKSEEDVRNMLASYNISVTLNRYAEPMFPGFQAKLKDGDLKGAFGLIKSSLGFDITGLDSENQEIIDAVKYIGETKKLPANLLDIIPKDTVLALTFDTEYSLRTVKGADGTEYQAIYIGYDVKDDPSTQPFGIFTVSERDGKTALYLRIEFMNIDIGLIEKA